MKTNNVLIVASDYKPKSGGRADYIDNLARGLITLGLRTRLLAVVQQHHKERIAFLQNYMPWVTSFEVAYDSRPNNLPGDRIVSMLEIIRCLSPGMRRVLEKSQVFRASVDSVMRLARVIHDDAPTMVVFGHLDMRLYPLALYLMECQIPYCVIVHGQEAPRLPNRINDLVLRGSVLKGAKRIVANSHYTKSLLAVWSFPDDTVKVIHPPIAEEAIKQASQLHTARLGTDPLKVVTLSRLVKGKGIDTVLRALTILTRRGIPYQYLIGGEGSERSSLELLTNRLGLNDKVHFIGYVRDDDKWRVLRNSDVFVMTSRAEPSWIESFGIAFIEAAAFGVPSVGSRGGGISEAVLDGQTGILVPEDSPEHLADALTVFYRNPGMQIEMGRAGSERAREQFAPAVIAASFQREILESA